MAIVVLPPCFDNLTRVGEAPEPVATEALINHQSREGASVNVVLSCTKSIALYTVPQSVRSASRARSDFSLLRSTITTDPPQSANALAASHPIPEVHLMMQVFPSIRASLDLCLARSFRMICVMSAQ